MNEISSDNALLGVDKEEGDDILEDVVTDWGDCCLYDASVDRFANDVVSSVIMAFVVGATNVNNAPPAVTTICCMISLLDLDTPLPNSLLAENVERGGSILLRPTSCCRRCFGLPQPLPSATKDLPIKQLPKECENAHATGNKPPRRNMATRPSRRFVGCCVAWCEDESERRRYGGNK